VFAIDRLILVAALLLLLGVVSNKLSSRFGLPVLVLFLMVGMLAGENGIGRIAFDDYRLAHGIGTLALAVILFDGGLRTPVSSVRAAWAPALVLATLGVALTGAVTGAAAVQLLGLPWLDGMLLGAIVASTDAAAVFSILRTGGLQLRGRLAATLEMESGSNDPMAVLLSVFLIQLILGGPADAGGFAGFLVRQLALGTLIGLAAGRGAALLTNRIRLEAAGLYPVLAAVCGLLSYGVAAVSGGNGFLSVYIAGIVLGNSRLAFKRSTLLLHDGLAWISQMVMFILLGLLVTPSELFTIAPQGMLLAVVVTLVARPAMILLTLAWFRFPLREMAFLSWAGLKGAVPIILATYPLMFGVPDARLLFNLVFFVVLVSAVTQGWTLRPLAVRLGVQVAGRAPAPVSLELTSLRDVEGDIVDYTVTEDSRAAGRRLRELALTEGAVVALITRGDQLIPPRGSTTLLAGDHVFAVLRPDTRSLVDRVFGSRAQVHEPLVAELEFPLQGSATVKDLRDFYGIELDAADDATLDQVIRGDLGHSTQAGDAIQLGAVRLRVREVVGNRIEWVGLSLLQKDATRSDRV
jgi:cell volume regulation protein A